jgi:hypothetical protein
MSDSLQPIATFEEFGAGWTAMRLDGSWLLFEPGVGTCDTRPAGLGESMWCVVTSDNPYGQPRSTAENAVDRGRLRSVVQSYTTTLESCGGVGLVSDPTRWPAGESGVAVPVDSIDDAVDLCQRFNQAAVYCFVGDERHLVDRNGERVAVQRYRVHHFASARTSGLTSTHATSCLCPFTRYDGSAFTGWTCVHGEVWRTASLGGGMSIPLRVFYGLRNDGLPVLLRSEPDAEAAPLTDPLLCADLRSYAVEEIERWVAELRDDRVLGPGVQGSEAG